MGRPYAAELLELDATYEWCMNAPITELARSVAAAAGCSLLCVGSGGSLTSAHFATFLHVRFTGQAAQTLTPFELVTTAQHLAGAAVLICSAGGSNPDVIAGADLAIKRGPHHLFAIATKANSPLQARLNDAVWPMCHTFTTPTKKDGFLATNSLLATMMLLTRAYETWAGAETCLPPTFTAMLHEGMTRRALVEKFRGDVADVVDRSTLIVLHGASTKPAAMDVESRFTEAALANAQPADYRNFAHGRHHWLARHTETSAVLAFSEEGDDVARKTLALIPAAIPRWQVCVEPGLRGAISAVCYSLLLAFVAGESKSLDPGRPHVPTFGRKLYHLRAMPRLYPQSDIADERMNLAIERKTQLPITGLAARGQLDSWRQHYRTFVERLATARIRAIAVDYDGTLCGAHRRLAGPSDDIIARLSALLDAGLTIAVATGRGKSVREALRKRITVASHRARLIVGYHNGAEIGPLSDAQCPPPEPALVAELEPIARALRANDIIQRHATVQAKGRQIALELLPFGDARAVFDEASRTVWERGGCGRITAVSSSHSVDIIAGGVSKSNVVDYLVKELDLADCGAFSVLCIGDRGRAPGNDADLLRHRLSLSVDEVSEDPATCWGIAAPGLRFDLACLEYLKRLRPGKGGARFDVKGVKP